MNRARLVEVAESEGIRPDVYSFVAPGKHHQYVLAIEPGGWTVYFVERDEHLDAEHFETEDEACQHLLSLLLRDRTTRTQFETREDVERRLQASEKRR